MRWQILDGVRCFDPRDTRRAAGFDFDSPLLLFGDRYRHLFAFIERLKKTNIHRARFQPLQAEMLDDRGSHVSIDGYAGDQAAAEAIFGSHGIVMDAVFRIDCRIHRAHQERSHRD